MSAPASSLPTVRLPSGERVPALGQGTWRMGERRDRRAQEVAALVRGLEAGLSLIDTAEMYGEGGAEEVVAEALAGRRDRAFLVSKVYPHNAGRRSAPAACERSLKRLRTDRIDLYLLHWRGDIPIEETVRALEGLVSAGKIRHWGVSNLDAADLREVFQAGGEACATDQILYNLVRRGPEWDLIPWCRERSIPVMAYSPVEQGALARDPRLAAMAERLGTTAAGIALAWLLRQGDTMVIPKVSRPEHVDDNRAALDITLSADDLNELDRLFPPPKGPRPLEML
jgi:diketogulonate reductase-like aldo/keto reductase